jgi:hypothetical protein
LIKNMCTTKYSTKRGKGMGKRQGANQGGWELSADRGSEEEDVGKVLLEGEAQDKKMRGRKRIKLAPHTKNNAPISTLIKERGRKKEKEKEKKLPASNIALITAWMVPRFPTAICGITLTDPPGYGKREREEK